MPAPAALRNRFYGNAALPTDRSQRPRAEFTATNGGGGVATVRIYEPIDSWGWPFGIAAVDVAAVLDELPEDTTEIRVLINSPGGEAFEGIAIMNLLRNHDARVVAIVEGLAASAASFIACSADETVMNASSQMMIHNASGFCMGDDGDMAQFATVLAKLSDNIADVYSTKAGGTREDWRAAMTPESWYLADEAVEAGLADRVGKADAPPSDGGKATNRFDLSIFAFAGRTAAPAPTNRVADKTPSAKPAQGPSPKEDADMALIDELRRRLGITDEAATDETVLAALDEALEEATDETGTTSPTVRLPDGVTTIETAVLDEMRGQIQQGVNASNTLAAQARDRILDEAIRDGKFPRARRAHYENLLTVDPEGAAEQIKNLAPGLIPITEIGNAETGDTSGPANTLDAVRETPVYKNWSL